MLTPRFDLSQTDEFLIISIHIPYAKITEIDFHHEDRDFMFYSKPYYLRLNLPGKVNHSEKPIYEYDFDKKIFIVKAEKAEKGQVFEGLDLITKLKKEKKIAASPLIEVIEDDLDAVQDYDECDDEEIDWNLQVKDFEELDSVSIKGDQCGFAKLYSYAVFQLKEEAGEIFDVKEPQSKSSRTEERLKIEFEHFDEDHYIADLYHDEEIQHLLKYRPDWEDIYDKIQADTSIISPDDIIQFSSEEKDRLLKLPNKEYILEKSQITMSLLGMVDILYAYAYNKRTTEGENTVESGWTINKLSATLSWLEVFTSLPEVALTCIRRSLCYPLYRHFELSVTILDDVRKILLLGRKYVMKCFLEIHELFCNSDPRYILNDLFITDYCVWLQTKSCSSKQLVPLANALEKVLLTKGDIRFNLVDIESFAAVAWMAHNPSAKEFPTNIRDKYVGTEADKEKPQTADNADDLCASLDKLSFQIKQSSEVDGSADGSADCRTLNELFDEYGSCSSCSSGSSCSSSYTFESDSDDSYSECGSSSSSDSEEDSDSSESDDGAHRHLLKKEIGERNR